jgi:hypothetical protein
VHVDPIKLKLKAPGSEHLKLKCDDALSNVAFNFSLRRYNAAGVRRHDFDGTTGPYPLESLQKWSRMSCYVTRDTLQACGIPAGTRVVPGDPDTSLYGKGKRFDGSGGGGEDAAAAVVPYFPGVARAPVFSAIAQRAPRGTAPAEVTRLNMDPGKAVQSKPKKLALKAPGTVLLKLN